MGIAVRPARPEEADALTDLSLRSKQSNGYDDAFMAACVEELTVRAADIEAGDFWVAEADGIRGCAWLCPDTDGPGGQVHAFFIDPARQRRGVGRLLWAHILKRATALGLMHLYLDADPNAVPFYEAMGFQVTGAVPSGSIPGRTIPRMTRALESA